jgi:hypothetical protein
MSAFVFDATTVEPAQTFQPLPAGAYVGLLTEATLAPLKSGQGEGLKLSLEILDGQYKGRKVWDQLNVRHSNPDTQRIAQQQLSALCRAVGVLRLEQTEQLCGKPVRILLKVRPADGKYEARNEVRGYEPANGVAPALTAQRPASAPAVTPAAPPWAAPAKA